MPSVKEQVKEAIDESFKNNSYCGVNSELAIEYAKTLTEMKYILPIVKNIDKVLCRGNGKPSVVEQTNANTLKIQDHVENGKQRYNIFLLKLSLILTVLLGIFSGCIAIYVGSYSKKQEITERDVKRIVVQIASKLSKGKTP